MLAATKNQLVTSLQNQQVQLKQMELNYWTRTFSAMTTEAALIAGFGFGGLSAISSYKASTMQTLYLVATSVSMGFGLLAMTTASLVLYYGPGKALRAPSLEAVEQTINDMKEKSHATFYFFIGELVFFHISSFLLMWILYTPFVAFCVNLVLLAFLL